MDDEEAAEDLLKNDDLDRTLESKELRRRIVELSGEYWRLVHSSKRFVPGKGPVPVSGKVFEAIDVQSLISSSLDFWLTAGRYNRAFESALSSRFGGRPARTTNSGSSANLMALSALMAPGLGPRVLSPGDEVITVAASFPTTLNPIIQNGLVPVFVDVQIPTYNGDPDLIEEAIGPRTKAIMLAHTLGNPFDLDRVQAIAEENGLWLIEDCCDALGSTYDGRQVGTFGDLATLSFYPAHHITTGEGGAVVSKDGRIDRIVTSIRDWGRDCYCEPGADNTCGRRYEGRFGDLPPMYDHKYVYSNLGYNLKMTDMQAAVGLSQLGHLDRFVSSRNRNFLSLRQRLEPLRDVFLLPEATEKSDPAWFGFPLTIKEEAGFERVGLLRHLERCGIGTRLLFGGNLIRQPYMLGRDHRSIGSLANTDLVMRSTFWVGVYPGITEEMAEYMVGSLCDYVEKARR